MNNFLHENKNNFVFEIISEDYKIGIIKSHLCAIIGKNASGKTTLLDSLAGFNTPRSDKINLFSKSIKDYSLAERACKLAYCGVNFHTDFNYSAYQYASFGHYPLKSRSKLFSSTNEVNKLNDELQDDIIEKFIEFKLIDHLHSSILSLSTGQKKLLSIIKAICQNSEIIILDEPTAHLDLDNQLLVMNYLKNLTITKKITIICVLHDLTLIQQFASYIIAMQNKKIIEYGTKDDIFNLELIENIFKIKVEKIKLNKNPQNHQDKKNQDKNDQKIFFLPDY